MKDYTIYVTEDIAKKAMEKGFECSYDNDDYTPHFRIGNPDGGFIYILPTAEQICGWLREKYWYITMDIAYHDSIDNYVIWHYEIYAGDNFQDEGEGVYKVALLEGINKALDLI